MRHSTIEITSFPGCAYDGASRLLNITNVIATANRAAYEYVDNSSLIHLCLPTKHNRPQWIGFLRGPSESVWGWGEGFGVVFGAEGERDEHSGVERMRRDRVCECGDSVEAVFGASGPNADIPAGEQRIHPDEGRPREPAPGAIFYR
jgi:hypothetical protein